MSTKTGQVVYRKKRGQNYFVARETGSIGYFPEKIVLTLCRCSENLLPMNNSSDPFVVPMPLLRKPVANE
jgi:hypothetical protein